MIQDPIALNPRLRRWRTSTFWVMLFGYVGYYLCRANMAAAFPLLSQTFGYTNSQLGLIALYSEITYSFGKFINGPLADRLDGRHVFLLGMGGAIACNLLFSQMSSLATFILVWCVCRFFLSMGWSALLKTIGAWYPPGKYGTVMGLISLNFQFGGVVGTLFAGLLVAKGCSWQAVFIYPALLVLVIWVWTFFGAKESPQKVDASFEWTDRPSAIISVEKTSSITDNLKNFCAILISDRFFFSVF